MLNVCPPGPLMDFGQVNPSCWVIIDGEQLCCHISERINGWWCLENMIFKLKVAAVSLGCLTFNWQKQRADDFLLPGDLSVKCLKLQRTKTKIEKWASSYNDKWRVFFCELIYPNSWYIKKKKKKIDSPPPSRPIHTLNTHFTFMQDRKMWQPSGFHT